MENNNRKTIAFAEANRNGPLMAMFTYRVKKLFRNMHFALQKELCRRPSRCRRMRDIGKA
jgi:hypothetical protein